MSTYSLDTDTKLLKKHPGNQPVVDRFRQEIQRNSLFVICPVVQSWDEPQVQDEVTP